MGCLHSHRFSFLHCGKADSQYENGRDLTDNENPRENPVLPAQNANGASSAITGLAFRLNVLSVI